MRTLRQELEGIIYACGSHSGADKFVIQRAAQRALALLPSHVDDVEAQPLVLKIANALGAAEHLTGSSVQTAKLIQKIMDEEADSELNEICANLTDDEAKILDAYILRRVANAKRSASEEFRAALYEAVLQLELGVLAFESRGCIDWNDLKKAADNGRALLAKLDSGKIEQVKQVTITSMADTDQFSEALIDAGKIIDEVLVAPGVSMKIQRVCSFCGKPPEVDGIWRIERFAGIERQFHASCTPRD